MADGKRAADVLTRFLQEWTDTEKLASNTVRTSLSGPVGQLQRIRRDVEAVQWPTCAAAASSLFLAGMNDEIDGFIRFLGFDETKIDPTLRTNYQIEVGIMGRARADADFADQMGTTQLVKSQATLERFRTALAQLASIS